MSYLRHDPAFHCPERVLLEQYANGGAWRPQDVLRALRVVGVGIVCLPWYDAARGTVLRQFGYVHLQTPSSYRCWQPG
jgi:hypothetical protein